MSTADGSGFDASVAKNKCFLLYEKPFLTCVDAQLICVYSGLSFTFR